MQLQQFSDSQALNAAFAADISAKLQQAIIERGTAVLVVSGGRTPLPLFQTLANTDLDWSKVTITLADDRYLPDDAPDSNERLVKSALLQHKAAVATFVSLYAPAEDAEAAVPELLARVRDLPRFDVVILGMGEDGHTASLFPCSKELNAGLADDAPDLLATNPTTAPYQRISFSKQRLAQGRAIFLHLVGSKKLQVLQQAAAGTDVAAMPIRAFIQLTDPELSVMYADQ
ncbi:6-phosphogluconolactonase [Rheinheimera texasensis]|jgi:6-phosphogluconolactonase|uniref:6-phosphogluconolactonase n=1 Tax=Rheinheimera texasensis TaxID=306205 RepID=UPI0004E28A10|nr:6-phosphogluconolactonase [Rheinheimera texasensis]